MGIRSQWEGAKVQDWGTEESEETVTEDMAQGKEPGGVEMDLLECGLRPLIFSSV